MLDGQVEVASEDAEVKARRSVGLAGPPDRRVLQVAELGELNGGNEQPPVARSGQLGEAAFREPEMLVRPQRRLVVLGDAVGRLLAGEDALEAARSSMSCTVGTARPEIYAAPVIVGAQS